MNAFAHIRAAALSDVGRQRKNNEDAFGCFPAAGVFCVADGMGGGDDGEVASAATVKSVERIAPDLTPPDGRAFPASRAADAVADAVNAASHWVYRRARARRLRGCGSTFVGLCFEAAKPAVAVALHAGDSRLYRLRNGDIQQITTDHSVTNMMGVRNEADINPLFRSMILRAVGVTEDVELERTPVDVASGDRFLLCSDGLSRMVSDDRLLKVCQAHEDAQAAAAALVAAANEAGGLDNVTVVVLDVGGLPDPAPETDGPLVKACADGFFGETYLQETELQTSDSESNDDMMACSVSAVGVADSARSRPGRWARLVDAAKRWFAPKRS